MCVFEECCSLVQMGTQGDVADPLAPQAQFRPRAFEKCSALRLIIALRKLSMILQT